MAILAKDKGGGDFQLVPEDVHLAVCDMVIDLGIQPSNHEKYPDRHQVYLRWQIPGETIKYTDKDGNEQEGPMVIGKFYTLSLHEKSNLRPDLENWRGRQFTEDELRGFDLIKILGVPCMVQVQHKANASGDKRAIVTGITKVPKGTPPPILDDGVGVVYDRDENAENYEKLPEWLQKKVDQQLDEPREMSSGVADDDGMPF